MQLLTIVSTILLRNPELSFQKQLNLNVLVEDAVLMYCKDHNLGKSVDQSSFFSADYSLTTGYLARAVVNNVLTGGCFATIHDINDAIENRDTCKIT